MVDVVTYFIPEVVITAHGLVNKKTEIKLSC